VANSRAACSIESNWSLELVVLCLTIAADGVLLQELVGTFFFQSAKQGRVHNLHQGRCRAHLFVMRVAEVLDVWPELSDRQRCWVGGSFGICT
jgi:hypothetical protein